MFGAYVDGEFRPGMVDLTGEDGEVERETTEFRDRIEPAADARFPAEAGRYHLYVSYACPWAHRTLVTRALRGLESAVSVDVLDPYRGEMGWQFSPEREGCTRDTVNGFDYLHEAYAAADAEYTGHVTVPVLWDRETETIVNNESREIMRMLDVAFAGNGVDLYPKGYRADVDRIIDDIYEPINNGVYRAGFAEEQAAYDAAVEELFDALDHWDEVLSERRYLAGDRLTEADVAMFTTLIRFDHVYHTHFKCNRRAIHEYDALWPYLRDLYQTPGVAETVNIDHIRDHYYRTHPNVNPNRIVAPGPELDFDAPHDRDALPGGPPSALVE
ncbi:glutathione S-transferase family protein [Halorubrum sp. Atlit-28R]|jgi:putative glutathione S-transferase|uniref:glutathione S-transferase family protein n=1 Tax=Halorubrum sp. Atlit-28R TaxID=2282129 RepID=UPI000EF27D03|nr:glutathione S-transferase family protein [Halorubrum sp. Atlit-28R]RLM51146.1 glutathione S-transferase family protein [Halorubrum sp. Atlit-28R]